MMTGRWHGLRDTPDLHDERRVGKVLKDTEEEIRVRQKIIQERNR
jgi:hypothetical protein